MDEFIEAVKGFFFTMTVTAIWMGLAMLITMAVHGEWFVFVIVFSLLPWAWVLIVLTLSRTK